MIIMQGDQVNIGVALSDTLGQIITPDDAATVEITLGALTRSTADAEYPVTWDPDELAWLFTATQSDTFAMDVGIRDLQVRVKFTDDTVGGAFVDHVYVKESQSKEVL